MTAIRDVKVPKPHTYERATVPVGATGNCSGEPQSVRDAYDRQQGGQK